MDNKFLNKVVDQIVSETKIEHDKRKIYVYPFPYVIFILPTHCRFSSILLPTSFNKHCGEVHNLNKDEVKYVWKEYTKKLLIK
jgi:hypothetical protein